jgi:hypothetical protein
MKRSFISRDKARSEAKYYHHPWSFGIWRITNETVNFFSVKHNVWTQSGFTVAHIKGIKKQISIEECFKKNPKFIP